AEKIKAKGVSSIICVSVNDPYTMNAWKNVIGAGAQGVDFYSDADGSFTRFMQKVAPLTCTLLICVPSMWWSFLLAAFSLAGIWIAGKKPRLGWLWCMAMEIPWTIWAIWLKQYGFA
ncbi:MAG: hypothetical protein ACKO96_04025, partial [Flammeovirgaceae bacterium]